MPVTVTLPLPPPAVMLPPLGCTGSLPLPRDGDTISTSANMDRSGCESAAKLLGTVLGRMQVSVPCSTSMRECPSGPRAKGDPGTGGVPGTPAAPLVTLSRNARLLPVLARRAARSEWAPVPYGRVGVPGAEPCGAAEAVVPQDTCALCRSTSRCVGLEEAWPYAAAGLAGAVPAASEAAAAASALLTAL